uniref:UPF0272 protein TGRD_656 n=1 Tax=Anthurium amnicola TaxID=1678845 RepID=A0A1D1Z794_9ARAE
MVINSLVIQAFRIMKNFKENYWQFFLLCDRESSNKEVQRRLVLLRCDASSSYIGATLKPLPALGAMPVETIPPACHLSNSSFLPLPFPSLFLPHLLPYVSSPIVSSPRIKQHHPKHHNRELPMVAAVLMATFPWP